ncbi:MAG TPA: fumarylacetoacetate hydrolase family protein [Methanomassiliicoccales archaeon]|jgi:2-keto-4-pentenoate hydratase/2-oxohepta-3-ene-1,7-dioic acid hydratase in catechol pathway
MRKGKIVCIGQNYREHIKELKNEVPSEPVIFLKPMSSRIGNEEAILIPGGVGRVDHEVELALVIGRTGRDIPKERAMDHVSGLAVFNDVTARDVQNAYRKAGLPWTLSKGMDTFAPMSEPKPLPATHGIHDLEISCRVNGKVRQQGNTSMMIYTPEELIAFISKWMTLEEGDVIATGTPSGVGPIVPGDLIEMRIEGVGTLTNPVRARP